MKSPFIGNSRIISMRVLVQSFDYTDAVATSIKILSIAICCNEKLTLQPYSF